MNAKTVSERVADLRARRLAAGMVKLEIWVYAEDVEKVKKEIAGTNAYRARIKRKYSKEKTK
jgi:hypothetical protein